MKRSRQCFSVSAYVHEGFGQSERWVERDGALGAPGLDDDMDGFAGAVAEGVGYAGRAGDCEAAGADKPFDDRFQEYVHARTTPLAEDSRRGHVVRSRGFLSREAREKLPWHNQKPGRGPPGLWFLHAGHSDRNGGYLLISSMISVP